MLFAPKRENLEELKEELVTDYHEVPLEDLYRHLETDPNTVSSERVWSFNFYFNLHIKLKYPERV